MKTRFAIRFRYRLLLLGAMGLLLACTASPESDATQPAATAVPPTQPAATAEPTPTAEPETIVPAGLIYRAEGGLWQVDADGQPQLLSAHRDGYPSPDLARVAVWDTQNTITVIDLAAGTEQDFVPENGRLGEFFGWADPQTILVGLWLTPEESDGPNSGHLAVLDVVSGQFAVLDPATLLASPPALGPNGDIIAYATFAGPMVYQTDTGPQPFKMEGFTGLTGFMPEGFNSPAWSPDGLKLAWIASGPNPAADGDWQTGLLIADIGRQTAQWLYFFDPAPMGGYPPAPVWSPDSQWLALRVNGADEAQSGLWLITADGSVEWKLDGNNLADVVWLADGRSLVHAIFDKDGRTSLGLYDAAHQVDFALDLPPGLPVSITGIVSRAATATQIPEPTAQATTVALPFAAATFRSDPFGFAFDYPTAWTVHNLGAIGSRGSATQFLESDRVAMQMTFYLWDPQNDLTAYIENRKTAWTASDMTVLAEEDWLLAADHPAASFVVQGQGGETAYFFYTTIADRYLELSGDQELDLLAVIAKTMRLFEPVASSDAADALGCLTAVTHTAESAACNVIDGIRSRNTAALPSFMANPFIIGYWRSEGVSVTLAEAIAELGNALLPAKPDAYPLTFTTDRSQFPPLLGIPVEGMFGPDVALDHIIYSEGWGLEGQGAALIFIAHNEDRSYWHGLIFSSEHFDKE